MALQNSPLGQLPAELRLKVYRFAFLHEGSLHHPKQTESPINVSLLTTCKEVKREARPELYTSNTFALTFGQLDEVKPESIPAVNIRSIEIADFVFGLAADEEKHRKDFDMGVLVKMFPNLKCVTMEYDGVPLTRRGNVPTQDYNIRPLGVGVYRCESAENDLRLEITWTCPSVVAAWVQLSKSWDTVTLEDANKAATAMLGNPDRKAHITPVTLVGWLAMEAFDRGEEGFQEVRELIGDQLCHFWYKTWAQRPERWKFSDLRCPRPVSTSRRESSDPGRLRTLAKAYERSGGWPSSVAKAPRSCERC